MMPENWDMSAKAVASRMHYVSLLMILQLFRLLKYLISGKIKRIKIRLELVGIQTNILFCES